MGIIHSRPRRLRQNSTVRSLVRETTLHTSDLVFPLFVKEGKGEREPIASMPGIFRYTPDELIKEIKECADLGIKTFALFPLIEEAKKDKFATEAMNVDGLYLRTIAEIKAMFTDIVLMTDVAMDPYSSDGHDGLVGELGEILNDETLEILAEMALAQANAGADIIGPSDMMDGRVAVIREALEEEGHVNTLIMSYTAKYASGFYGPFRDALNSAPKKGDKKTYQMDFANVNEAIKEAQLDEAEGADILMVKPGLPYLDIIRAISEVTPLPIAAYNVSGEYAMIKAAAANGWIDNNLTMVECLHSFKRAGAKIILTYFAKEYAQLVNR